jgi:regulatory subunit for Cdc7p protein kinase
MKIWNSTKLDSVLSRCLDLPSVSKDISTKSQPPPTRQLERLLANEKTHGPSDRDPSQKRHDYRYFTKGSFFVLVEDLFDKTATIAMHEYPPTKDQKGKVPWPVLHCDSRSRGPFIAFDEKEKARWEKAQKAKNKTEVVDRKEAVLKDTRREAEAHVKAMGDLRRSVSLNNLHKRWAKEEPEADVPDSTNASGFLVSGTGPGYMAASGNSVGVTSTTGTTSTTSGMAQGHLPLNIDSLLKRQVVTSRRALPKGKPGNMEPPPIPSRPGHLKKSKSTNTLKLSKREEGSKPGYCESCRLKFDDFKTVSDLASEVDICIEVFLSTFFLPSIVDSRRMIATLLPLTQSSTDCSEDLWQRLNRLNNFDNPARR